MNATGMERDNLILAAQTGDPAAITRLLAVCKADAVARLWAVGDSFGATMEWHIANGLGKLMIIITPDYEIKEVEA